MSRRSFTGIALAIALCLGVACGPLGSGCSGSLPGEKSAYVGLWETQEVSLRVRESGCVDYRRNQGGRRVEIHAPIQRFEGDDFWVGIWLLSTRFEVGQPPYLEGGVWKMSVDGRTLTRVRESEGRGNEADGLEV